MYGPEEIYEPDEILMDIDAEQEFRPEDDLHELTFETGHEAAEGMSLLMSDVESPEELFALG